jgi:hypothetical protein
MSPVQATSTVSDGHSSADQTPNRQFFFLSARFRAIRVGHSFLSKRRVKFEVMFCSHGFSGLRDLLSILSYLITRKSTLENFRMVVLSAVPNPNRKLGVITSFQGLRSRDSTDPIAD